MLNAVRGMVFLFDVIWLADVTREGISHAQSHARAAAAGSSLKPPVSERGYQKTDVDRQFMGSTH